MTRPLRLQVQITADGYMAGPGCEMDWMTMPWSADMEEYVGEITKSFDTILLGRNLAEGFIPHWSSGPEGEPQEAIDRMNGSRRVVMSRTLTESKWENAVVASDLDATVADLKNEDSSSAIVAYGGGELIANLIAGGLADEINLFMNPVAIGGGMPVFGIGSRIALETEQACRFDCGVTALRLRPASAT